MLKTYHDDKISVYFCYRVQYGEKKLEKKKDYLPFEGVSLFYIYLVSGIMTAADLLLILTTFVLKDVLNTVYPKISLNGEP